MARDFSTSIFTALLDVQLFLFYYLGDGNSWGFSHRAEGTSGCLWKLGDGRPLVKWVVVKAMVEGWHIIMWTEMSAYIN